MSAGFSSGFSPGFGAGAGALANPFTADWSVDFGVGTLPVSFAFSGTSTLSVVTVAQVRRALLLGTVARTRHYSLRLHLIRAAGAAPPAASSAHARTMGGSFQVSMRKPRRGYALSRRTKIVLTAQVLRGNTMFPPWPPFDQTMSMR